MSTLTCYDASTSATSLKVVYNRGSIDYRPIVSNRGSMSETSWILVGSLFFFEHQDAWFTSTYLTKKENTT